MYKHGVGLYVKSVKIVSSQDAIEILFRILICPALTIKHITIREAITARRGWLLFVFKTATETLCV